MRAWSVLGCIGLLLWPILSWAEGGALVKALHPDVGWSPGRTESIPFLNPDRFHMSQSYAVQFMSTGKESWSTGLYLNTISYEFAIPLSMQLRVGYMHDPSMLFRSSEGAVGEGRLFIPDFQITYRPKPHMIFRLRYHMAPPGWTGFRFRRSLLDPTWDEVEW